jgi:transposase InsO family protein
MTPSAKREVLAVLVQEHHVPVRRACQAVRLSRAAYYQTDNGPEFSLAFVLAVERACIRHRYIRPRCPQQNGKVERSHRIDNEEFWSRHSFGLFETAEAALGGWERVYNEVRFSMALGGRTPAEKLAAVLAAA